MIVRELIERLQTLDQDREIMILDGFNAGGYPRTINIPPSDHEIQRIDILDCGDCEEMPIGHKVYVMGYGCY